MKNRPCDIDVDLASIPNDQSYGYRSPNNVSLQTGEEFSPAFLRDRSTFRRSPFVNDILKPDFHAIQHENHHPAYEELSVLPRARRRDSNSSMDFSDYLPRKEYDYDMDDRTGSSGYCRELPPCSHHKRIVSEDLDKVNSFGPSIYLLNSPSHSEPGSEGSRILDCSFSGQMKFLCSFGGSILQRPNDGKHRYIGGDTKIISFRKDLGYLELLKKTTAMCNYPHTIKYQLPGEDLDALISVASDEDLHHMIEEYQELERSSHRLRLFLVYSGDVEVQNVSEPRIIKYTDADYWYEVAVNGIVETSNNRSLSRDSLEVPYLNGISTLPKDSSTSFPRIENQKGESSILKPMLLTPSVQDLSSSQAPCMSKPSFQHIVPKTCATRHCENADCHHGYESNIQCITDTPECANSCFLDASAYYQHDFGVLSGINSQQSRGPPTVCPHILQHSEDFQSPPLYDCSSYSDAARSVPVAFPLHSEKLVPSPDTFCFVPVPDNNSHPCPRETNFFNESQPSNKERTHVNFSSKEPVLCRISSSPREAGREKQIIDDKYKISENEGAVSQGTPTLDKDFIHWGEETIKLKKSNKSSGDGWEFSLNGPCMEQKNNLQRIRCLPDSDVSFHVPASPQLVKECKYSSLSTYSENSPQILEGLPVNHQMSVHMPEAATKNQYVESNLKNHIPNLIDDDMPFLEYHGLIQTVVVEGSKRESQLRPVAFSQNESSSGSCLDVPIVHHATTRVDNVDGEVSATKERVNDPCLSEENEESNRYSIHVLNAENGTSIMPVKVNNVIAKLPSGVPAALIMPHVNEGQVYEMESPGEETDVESIIYESDDEDAKVDEDEKDASLSDAAIIEMEASMYGLQIIRNIDLEDLHELGSGTFGTVYHGKWRGTDVAIKRIKKSCFAGRSSEQERLTKDFWREAKIISRLHHPNIVAFYGVVPDGPDCTFATVTEYMANGSLRHVLFRRDRSIDRRKKVMIALDAAFGMEYLHLRNIVHFDLKCDNLLVNLGDPQRPVCKVGDFGLSRIKQNTLVSGGVRGTLPWMAPELLDGGSNRVTEKVDVFSFGIAMWEILTGEEPYLHMHCGAIIGGIVNNTLRPKIPERCDPEWRKLMEDCWSHDPSARPSFPEITKRLRVLSTAFQAKKYNRTRR